MVPFVLSDTGIDLTRLDCTTKQATASKSDVFDIITTTEPNRVPELGVEDAV